jgi:AcrR family transcriptional regulator
VTQYRLRVSARVKKPKPKQLRPGGRTALATGRILEATVQLVAELGVPAVTYDAVAKLAGTSRATIYRKWPSRDELVKDALVRFAKLSVSAPDTGDLRADLVEFLVRVGGVLATPVGRAVINASLVGENTRLRAVGREVLGQRLKAFEARLVVATARGELPAVDASFLNLMLIGPLYLHVMRSEAPVSRAFAARVVDAVLAGARSARPP